MHGNHSRNPTHARTAAPRVRGTTDTWHQLWKRLVEGEEMSQIWKERGLCKVVSKRQAESTVICGDSNGGQSAQ